jgi:hypothetical protein
VLIRQCPADGAQRNLQLLEVTHPVDRRRDARMLPQLLQRNLKFRQHFEFFVNYLLSILPNLLRFLRASE